MPSLFRPHWSSKLPSMDERDREWSQGRFQRMHNVEAGHIEMLSYKVQTRKTKMHKSEALHVTG